MKTALAALAWLVVACATTPTTTSIPPAEADLGPGADASDQPPSFIQRQPEGSPYYSVPRIGVIDGRVVTVAHNRLEVVGPSLAGPPAEISMFVGPITRVTIDGQVGRFDQIRPGMEVEASYSQDHSTVIAERIAARSR